MTFRIDARELEQLNRDMNRLKKKGVKQFNIAFRKAAKGTLVETRREAREDTFTNTSFAKRAATGNDQIISRGKYLLKYTFFRPNLAFLKGAKFLAKNRGFRYPTKKGRRQDKFFAIPGKGGANGRKIAYKRTGKARGDITAVYGKSYADWAASREGKNAIRQAYHTRMIKGIAQRMKFLSLKR